MVCVSCIDETRANIMLQIWKEKGKKLPGEKKKRNHFWNQVVKKVNKKVNAAQAWQGLRKPTSQLVDHFQKKNPRSLTVQPSMEDSPL